MKVHVQPYKMSILKIEIVGAVVRGRVSKLAHLKSFGRVELKNGPIDFNDWYTKWKPIKNSENLSGTFFLGHFRFWVIVDLNFQKKNFDKFSQPNSRTIADRDKR